MAWWKIAIYTSAAWLFWLFVVTTGISCAIVSRATAHHVDQDRLERITTAASLLMTTGPGVIWGLCYGLRLGFPALLESISRPGRARRLPDGTRSRARRRKPKAGGTAWWIIATCASIAWALVSFAVVIGVLIAYESAHPTGPLISEARGYVTGQAAGILAASGAFIIWISLYFRSRESPRR